MSSYRRALRALALAAALTCLAAAAAHASRLQIDNWERGIRLRWMSLQFTVAGRTVDCEVILNGDFLARTFAKTAGTAIARVTEATTINRCSNGEATILRATLPWEIRYASYSGTLPRITSVNLQIVGMAVLIEPPLGPSCLARTSVANPALLRANVEREEATFQNVVLNETALIPASGLMCGGTATFGGTGVITVRAEVASVIIHLI